MTDLCLSKRYCLFVSLLFNWSSKAEILVSTCSMFPNHCSVDQKCSPQSFHQKGDEKCQRALTERNTAVDFDCWLVEKCNFYWLTSTYCAYEPPTHHHHHAPMHHPCTDPCTAQLARQPKSQFDPSGRIRDGTTWYCCCYFPNYENLLKLFSFGALGSLKTLRTTGLATW